MRKSNLIHRHFGDQSMKGSHQIFVDDGPESSLFLECGKAVSVHELQLAKEGGFSRLRGSQEKQ